MAGRAGVSFRRMINSIMSLGALDLGIDLGTANTLVCVPGKGLVLLEPSVVAIKTGSSPPVVPLNGRAVGNEAKRMIERTPENIRAIRPLKDGVIADFEITEIMLRYFIHKVQRRSWGMRPRLLRRPSRTAASTPARAGSTPWPNPRREPSAPASRSASPSAA